MRRNIPVVSGQVTSALNSLASLRRNSPTVANLPFGIFRTSSSTSFGVGISIWLLPNLVIFGGIATTFASCAFSNFARQLVRLLNLVVISGKLRSLKSVNDLIILFGPAEKTNAGNATRASRQTQGRILGSDAAEREQRKSA